MKNIFRLATAMVIGVLTPAPSFAQYAPQKFNISGSLFQSNGLPVTQSSVDFKVEILDKNASCVLYSEDHLAQNLNTSKGGFALEVGSGANGHNSVNNTAVLGWSVFANNGATTILDGTCGGTVTFNQGDERLIRISYNTGSGLTAMTPNVPISSAAFAMVADTLDGKSSNEFIQVRDDVGTDLNQTNVENVFSAANFAKLLHLLNNTFTSGYSFNGQRVTDVAAPTAGTDAVNRDYANTHIGSNTVDFTGIGSGVGSGRTLVWDGTQWVTGVPNAIDNSKLPLAGGTMSGPITMGGQQIYNTGHITMGNQTLLQLGTYTNGQEGALTLAGPDAGKILYNTDMGAVRMWNGTGFSGFAPSGAAGGDLTGSYPNPTISLGAVVENRIGADAVTAAKIHSAGIASNRLVSSDATGGTTLRFVGCALNQVMSFDAAGGWTCTTVQTLIGASGVTGGPWGTSTSVARFGVNALGAVTMATEVPIVFPVTTVAGRTGNVVLTAADISFLDLATVTQVVAGNALVGGGGPGVVTLGVDESAINIDPTQISQYGAAANQVLTWNGSAWLPAANVDTGITNVIAGFGLSGGGTSNTVTVSLDNSAVSINSTQITQSAAGAGQVLKWNGTHWLPANDAGAAGVVTQVDTGPGLLGGPITSTGSIYLDVSGVGAGSYGAAGAFMPTFSVDIYGRMTAAGSAGILIPSTSLTQTAAGSGQVLKWNGSAWLPADDNNAGGDITDVVAGSGMTGGGTTGAVTIGLGDTAATPGSFGSATESATYTVDQQGRLTASGQTAIALPSTSLTQTSAASGQTLKWNGTHWLPANDTDTGILNVVVSTGLFGGGTSPSVTIGLDDTAVVVGTYGTANQVSRFTVDQQGRITSASEVAIAIPGTQITQTGAGVGQVLKWNGSAWLPQNDAGAAGVVTQVDTGPGLLGGPITTSGSIYLDVSGVGAGSYGVAGAFMPTFSVDVYGRVTAAGSAGILIPSTSLTQTAAGSGQVLKWNGSAWLPADDNNAGGDITDVIAGSGMTGGGTTGAVTIGLGDTAATPGSFGSATQSATYTVDQQGRLTASGQTAIAIPATSVTQTGAAAGQSLKWNGTHWLPADDVDTGITNVVTGVGLSGGGATPAVTVTLDVSGVGAGSYGVAGAYMPTFSVDVFGRVTAAGSAGILIPSTSLTQTAAGSGQVLKWNGSAWLPADDNNAGGDITDVVAGNGMTGGGASGAVTIGLGDTAATPGSFGSATQSATYTVDQQGRLTASGQTAIAIPATSVTQTGAASGQVLKWNGTHWMPADDAGAAGIVARVDTGPGLLGGPITNTGSVYLDVSGVGAGSYGVAGGFMPTFSVDIYGRVTAAGSAGILIPSTSLTQTAAGSGQVLKWNGSAWLPADDNNAGGDITDVVAGNGMTGGGTSGAVTVGLGDTAATPGSFGSATQSATYTVDQQGRLTASGQTAIAIPATSVTQTGAATGQALKWNGTHWLPANDVDTGITNVIAGFGLSGGGASPSVTVSLDNSAVSINSTQITQSAAGAGQVLKWNGTHWLPADDAGAAGIVARVDTGPGLLGGPITNTGSVYLDVSGVGAGSYGAAGAFIPTFSVDIYGRVTAAGSAGILIPSTSLTQTAAGSGQVLKWNGSAWLPADDNNAGGDITEVIAGSGMTGGGTSGAVTVGLGDTAATPGSFGSATQSATYTVDQQGRLTASGQTAIAIPSTSVTQTGAASGQVLKWNGTHWMPADDAGAAGIVARVDTGPGLLGGPITNTGSVYLDVSGVGAGSYGVTGAFMPTFSVDIYGRVTTAGSAAVIVPSTSISQTAAGSGQVLKWNGSAWLPADDNNAGGDITDVVAGNGMTGGGSSGAVTVGLGDTAATPGSFGSATQSATYTVDQQGRLTASGQTAIAIPSTSVTQTGAASGQSLKWNGTHWLPADDVDTGITSVVAGVGLSGGGATPAVTVTLDVSGVGAGSYGVAGAFMPTFSVDVFGRVTAAGSAGILIPSTSLTQTAAGSGQVLKWNGSAWLPADDNNAGGDITDVVAGAGMTGGGTSGSVTVGLGDTAATPGSFGSATQSATYTVDQQGRLTASGQTAIAIPSTSVTQTGAASGQVLKWNGSAWLPQDDVGVAALAAGNGILLTGTASTIQTVAVDTGIAANKILQLDGSGALGIGTAGVTAGAILDLFATGTNNSSLLLPRATTADRPATGVDGMIRYNTSLAKFEVYENGNWYNMATGATGDNLGNHIATTGVVGITGTAAAPSYTFAGGAPRGIYALGTGGLAVGTSAAPRLVVDASGNVGIGTTAPVVPLEVRGIHAQTAAGWHAGLVNEFDVAPGAASSANAYTGLYSRLTTSSSNVTGRDFMGLDTSVHLNGGAGDINSAQGLSSVVANYTNRTLDYAYGGNFRVEMNSTGTIEEASAIGASVSQTSGTILNGYGVNIGQVQGTNSRYSLYASDVNAPSYFAARVGVGTTAPNAGSVLDLNGTGVTSSLIVPRETSANRPTTGVNGMIRYNTNLAAFEVYANGTWSPLLTNATAPAGDNLGNHIATAAVVGLTGTAAAPSYTFAGAANRGMYALGTGAIALSAGSANRLTVQANGNVGIGTAAPADALDVAGRVQFRSDGGVAWTTLSGNINSSVTTINVGSTAGFPDAGVLWIGLEPMSYTGKTGTSFTGVTRGIYGTGGGDHYTNDVVTYQVFGISANDRPLFNVLGNGSIQGGNPGIYATSASGQSSVALGYQTFAAGNQSVTLGAYNYARGEDSVSIGRNVASYGEKGIALGSEAVAFGNYSTVLGHRVETGVAYGGNNLGYYSMGIGLGSAAGTRPRVSGNRSLGIFMGDQSGVDVSDNNVMAVLGGAVGIGTTSPGAGAIMNLQGTGAAYSSLIVPRETSANRPTTGVNGMIRYNTNLAAFEVYANGNWTSLATGSGGGDNLGNHAATTSITAVTGTAGGTSYAFTGGNFRGMYALGTGGVALSTDNTDRIRITPHGSVSIGTTGSADMFEMAGGMRQGRAISVTPGTDVGVHTTLSGNINNSQTTIPLTSAAGFPSAGRAKINSHEIVTYTGISGNTLTGVTRGTDGSSALASNAGDYVVYYLQSSAIVRDDGGGPVYGVTSDGFVWASGMKNTLDTFWPSSLDMYNGGSGGFSFFAGPFDYNAGGSNYSSFNMGYNIPSRLSGGSNTFSNGSQKPLQLNELGGAVVAGGYGAAGSFAASPTLYMDYNVSASQSGTTVTGSGTAFTASMIGSTISYANGTFGGTITAVASATSMTVTTNQTVSGQRFTINYPGLQVSSLGRVAIGSSAPATGSVLDLTGTGAADSSLIVPRGLSSARAATGVNGMIRYNTNLAAFEVYANGNWATMATGSGGGSQWNNGASSSINYTAGNVAIGTTNASDPLTLERDFAGNAAMKISNPRNTGWVGGQVGFAGAGGTNMGSLEFAWDGGNTTNSAVDLMVRKDNSMHSVIKINQWGVDDQPVVHIGPYNFGSIPNTARLNVNSRSAAGNSVLTGLSLNNIDTDGGASNGIGNRISFGAETSVHTTNTETAYIESVLDDANDNSKDGSLRFATLGPDAQSAQVNASERMRINSSGQVGIGTASPMMGALLDIFGTGAGDSSIIVPRGLASARPTTGINGMLRYNTNLSRFEVYQNSQWASLATGASNYALPNADGTNGQVLTTNGSGLVTWATPSGGGGGSNGWAGASVATAEARNSTSYGDLATVGPSVTFATGDSVAVTVTAHMTTGTASRTCAMGFSINGGAIADDTKALMVRLTATSDTNRFSATFNVTGLTPGSNTFTAKYRDVTAANACTFADRNIVVVATIPPPCTDTAPDGFSLNNLTNQTTSTQVSSNIVQVAGIACSVPAAISGLGSPQLRICSDSGCSTVLQDWTSAPSNIASGQYIQARVTTSASSGATTAVSLAIGTVSTIWNVSTTGADCNDPSPPVGTLCADGTVYAGLSPDGNVKMFTTRCDAGQSWDGSACTGVRAGITFSSAYGSGFSGHTSTSTGRLNTAMVADLVNAVSPYPAALYCRNLNAAGKYDWYLPASGELSVLYANRTAIGSFDTSGSYYWSSSCYVPSFPDYRSRTVRFSTGAGGDESNENPLYVRCVRKSESCTDTTPSAFTVANLSNQATSTVVTSATAQLSGFSCAVATSISGQGSPEYRVCADPSCSGVAQNWTTGASTIQPHQFIQLRTTSSASAGVVHTVTMTAGGVNYNWTVATTASCAGLPGSPPPVGTVCADGTVYAGFSPDGNVPMFTTRCDTGQTWDGVTCSGAPFTFGFSSNEAWITHAGMSNPTTGEANSAYYAARVDAGSPYPAAIHCEGISDHGFTDWYLPALNELNVLYGGKSAIGSFQSSYQYNVYVSSTREGDYNAKVVDFVNGSTYDWARHWANYFVRCVRR